MLFRRGKIDKMTLKYGVLLISLFIGSLALPSTPAEDDFSEYFIHADSSARIVGGSQAAEGSAPYMVAMSNGLLVRGFVCGGSIINQDKVLTAAHCIGSVFIWGSLSISLRVTVGTNRWNLGGQSYTVARNITHPNYVWSTLKNDIGILVTRSKIVYSNVVQPVPLSWDEVGAGVVARAAGWGRIRADGSPSTQLLELMVTTIGGQQCVEAAERASVEFDIPAPPVEPHLEICTFHSAGHGMCNGDSGSALVRVDRQEQIALVSWGFPCALGAPDVFVRLSAYRDWLLALI